MKTYTYTKSFLLFLQIVFFLLLSVQTFFATVFYVNDEVPFAVVLPIMIFIFYIKLLYNTAEMYNKEKRGKAYFYTIAGFFIATFIQIGSCTLISPIIISGR